MIEEETKRRTRGPGKLPRKVHVTMRIPQHVYDYYKGDITRMRDDIVLYVESKIEHSE